MNDKRDLLIASLVVSIVILMLFVFMFTQIGNNIVVNDISLEVTPFSGQNAEYDNSNTEIPTPIPGVFAAGYTVKIFNTGGDGLRIRLEPGLNSQPLFLGVEGEEFRIIEGPNISDNKVWWMIEAANDPSRAGWAAQDYLMIIN